MLADASAGAAAGESADAGAASCRASSRPSLTGAGSGVLETEEMGLEPLGADAAAT